MKRLTRLAKSALLASSLLILASCATYGDDNGAPLAKWAANGYLSPSQSEPQLIGTYLTKRACEDAVEAWLARQVVGNPISGECLPIDRR